MGLDIVELVCAVEEAFDITISDEEGMEIRTVEEIYSCILEKLEKSERLGEHSTRACLSSVTFYRARRALMSAFAIPRKSVTPGSFLQDFVPGNQRQMHWQRLGECLELSLPPLHRPARMENFIWGTGFVLFIVGIVGIFSRSLPLFLLLPVSYLLYWVASKLTEPFAVHIPTGCVTLRGLVKYLMAMNYGKLAESRKEWSRKEVWQALCAIFYHVLSIEPEQLKEDARIVEDLGID